MPSRGEDRPIPLKMLRLGLHLSRSVGRGVAFRLGDLFLEKPEAVWHVFCVQRGECLHMVRIVTERSESGWIVHVQGHLRAEDLPALEETCREASPISQLNLDGLRGLDEAGIAAIRKLTMQGAVLTGASPYIRMRLTSRGAKLS
jgi:hypothetical protein